MRLLLLLPKWPTFRERVSGPRHGLTGGLSRLAVCSLLLAGACGSTPSDGAGEGFGSEQSGVTTRSDDQGGDGNSDGADNPGNSDSSPITNEAPADVFGPNQSPADVARDGVVPALAELGLRDRMEPLFELAIDDGYWVGSQLPQYTIEAGCVGDDAGRYGVDFVCGGYGEVLLLNEFRLLERAFPMPYGLPTWVAVNENSVFVGHIGDGAEPYSTVTRINPMTFASQTWVLSASIELQDSGLPEYPDWDTTAVGPAWIHATSAQVEGLADAVDEATDIAIARATGKSQYTASQSAIVVEVDKLEALFPFE